MATRKKSSTSKTSATRTKRRKRSGSNPIDDALARLERDIPRLLRQLRTNVQDLQGQVDRARADGEKRWRDAERKIKKDAAELRQKLETRLEGAVGRIRGKAKAKAGKASRPRKSTRKRSA